MNRRDGTPVSARVFASILAVLAGGVPLRADQIEFSKPAVEIATPAKAEEFLPATTSKRLGFDTPQMAPPVVVRQQPAIIRRAPREEDEEEDRLPFRNSSRSGDTTSRNRSVRDPRETKLPDALAHPRTGREPLGLERPDSQQALAPVMDLNWDAGESKKNPTRATLGRSGYGERNDPNDRDRDRSEGHKPAFFSGREEDVDRNSGFQVARFSDLFGGAPKEKPSQEILDRRATFEQLLNPGAAVAGRTPGSLEPVPSLDPTTVVPGLPMPTLGRLKGESRSADPMQAFNVQQDRLRGPSIEDVNRKYSKPASGNSSPALESRFQTPLNRQPTMRELPTRKF
jgi:hypothetical protein